MKDMVPCMKDMVPCMKEIVPCVKEMVPCMKEMVPCVKEMAPLLRVRTSRKSGCTISGGVPSMFYKCAPTLGQVDLEFWR